MRWTAPLLALLLTTSSQAQAPKVIDAHGKPVPATPTDRDYAKALAAALREATYGIKAHRQPDRGAPRQPAAVRGYGNTVSLGVEVTRMRFKTPALAQAYLKAPWEQVVQADTKLPTCLWTMKGKGVSKKLLQRFLHLKATSKGPKDLGKALGWRFAKRQTMSGETPIKGHGRVRFRSLVLGFATLEVTRVSFSSPADAARWVRLNPKAIARVDPKHPRIVTRLQGPNAARAVLAEVEGVFKKGIQLPRSTDFANRIQRVEVERKGFTAFSLPPKPGVLPAFEAVRVQLGRLTVIRLRCDSAASARWLVEQCFQGGATRWVADHAGDQVVLLAGSSLEHVQRAIVVLDAAWKGWHAPQGARGTTAVFSKVDKPGEMAKNFAGFTVENGPFYQAGANAIRTGRKKAKDGLRGSTPSIKWKFLDPATRNRLRFSARDMDGIAFATESTMLFSIGQDRKRAKHEYDYLLALLRGIGRKIPAPAKGLVQLLDPPK